MGWSDPTIMGGDPPMDYLAHIQEEILGCFYDEDTGDWEPHTWEHLTEEAPSILRFCRKTRDAVAFEVWGLMMLDAKGEPAWNVEHIAEIVRVIDGDIAKVPEQGWSDPNERIYHLEVLRDQLKAQAHGNLVDIKEASQRLLQRRVRDAMQDGFAGCSDPALVQRAVARFLMDLQKEEDLDNWGYAAKAIVRVGTALQEARGTLALDEATETARSVVGA